LQETAQIEREIEILKRIDHINCVKLYNVFHSANQVSLVMELMSGGELFDRIIEKVRTTHPADKSRHGYYGDVRPHRIIAFILRQRLDTSSRIKANPLPAWLLLCTIFVQLRQAFR
jgi:serine/threonine protein kinase